MPEIVSEAGNGFAKSVVARPSEDDASAFAGGVGNRANAGFCGELVIGEVTISDIAELGKDLGGTDTAGTREGHDDLSVRELGDGVLDARGQFGNLGDELFEQRGEGAGEFSLRVSFGVLGMPGWRVPKSVEELGRGTAPAIAVLSQEAGEPLLAEAGSAFGCGIAADEGKSDRAVDSSKDSSSTGPEAVEQAAQLVGESSPLVDEIIPAAHQHPQCANIVGDGTERTEPMSIGAQDIGEHIGITGIGLTACGAVSRTAGFDDVGMDRDDRMARLDQRVDEQPRGTLNCDGHVRRRGDLAQRRQQRRKARRVMANLTTSHDLAAIVDDTDGVARATPVQSGMISHMLISSNWRSSTRAGRSGGSLTDWRSGRQALAHHPVVRCGLPAPAVQRVSCGPSNGERTWSSRQMLRLLNTTPLRGFASNSREVHQ